MTMPIKHKHYDLICAWAAGNKIEVQSVFHPEKWHPILNPMWEPNRTYRIKPEREYPKTSLSEYELQALLTETIKANKYAVGQNTIMVTVANAAIKRYIQDTEGS